MIRLLRLGQIIKILYCVCDKLGRVWPTHNKIASTTVPRVPRIYYAIAITIAYNVHLFFSLHGITHCTFRGKFQERRLSSFGICGLQLEGLEHCPVPCPDPASCRLMRNAGLMLMLMLFYPRQLPIVHSLSCPPSLQLPAGRSRSGAAIIKGRAAAIAERARLESQQW